MSEYPKQDHNRVRRVPKRAHYERESVYEVLDDGYVAHVGFAMEGRPFVIPMLYGREEDTIFLHASTKSRFYKDLAEGLPVCLTVTHIDGIVLARSAFHHSMNYRSVVAHGHCRPVNIEERERALKVFTEKLVPGRWDECRPVTEKEIEVTGVLAFTMEAASAKIRTGGPSDDAEDYALPIWAGVVPLVLQKDAPIPDEQMTGDYPLPESVKNLDVPD